MMLSQFQNPNRWVLTGEYKNRWVGIVITIRQYFIYMHDLPKCEKILRKFNFALFSDPTWSKANQSSGRSQAEVIEWSGSKVRRGPWITAGRISGNDGKLHDYYFRSVCWYNLTVKYFLSCPVSTDL